MKKLIYVIEAIVSAAMLGSMLWDGSSWLNNQWREHWNKVHKQGYDEGFECGKLIGKCETK